MEKRLFPHIELDADFREAIAACDRILTVKGNDYTQGEGRLKNFYTNAARLGISAEKVLGLYMFKHIDALETYFKRGCLESEPIDGRIFDTINYLLLFYKMLQERRRDDAAEAAKQVKESK